MVAKAARYVARHAAVVCSAMETCLSAERKEENGDASGWWTGGRIR
jgi:hypothetical protein